MAFPDDDLQRIRREARFRTTRAIERKEGAWVWIDGRRLLNFSSNDYLGLSAHPRVIAAAAEAARRFGAGSPSARLLSGNLALHDELERALAALKGEEAALLFGSGYLANVGALDAVAGHGDLLLSDALNHASLVDGCRLSRARTCVYPHADLGALEALLRQAPRSDSAGGGRVWIVSDTLFSMDGDRAPLPELLTLAQRHGARLLLDDAHATGVFGERGGGLTDAPGVRGQADLVVSTLSKAFGVYGGFVAGKRAFIDFLRNRARTFIFSTALPPPTVAAALEAVRVAATEPERRARVLGLAAAACAGLRARGVEVLGEGSPILAVVVGDERRALDLSHRLFENGLFIPAIRPPTVPPGTSRLRISLSAAHEPEQVETLVQIVAATVANPDNGGEQV
ncbi:MAG: 8-amino-7-oxononanoate synthase [Planctomycetes bacterium]|nr:8-amino-7-oxononanoate synthase [Planctomycetota bacterium]